MSLTHIELSNSITSTVRGNLSWPSITWCGKNWDQYLVVGESKSRLFNIQDGSIVKHSPLVDRLVSESLTVSTSQDAQLLVGVQKDGSLFAWNIPHNVVYTVAALPQFKHKGDKLKVFMAGDVSRILMVKNSNAFYLWLRSDRPKKMKHPPKTVPLSGRWFTIDSPTRIPLPVDGIETAVDHLRLDQETMCSVAFVDGNGVLQLSTVAVTTEPSLYAQRTIPHADWYTLPVAGTATIPIASSPELLMVRYAPTLPMCAVVINQLSVRDRCIMFVSPQHRHLVAADSQCIRQSSISGRRPLWIADAGWTYNSLLFIVLTQCGCITILSRLGNPLYVTTREMSPGSLYYVISLLPTNISSGRKGSRLNRSLSLSSVAERIVSLTSHPNRMKFLISDGTQVMIFQIPEDVTTRSLAMALLSDARIIDKNKMAALDSTSTDDLKDKSRDSLRALLQVWCLLVSNGSWSRELKDVSNEVVRTIAALVRSMISTEDIEGSAVRLASTAVKLISLVAVDSHRQHVLPASIKLIFTMVKIILAHEVNLSAKVKLCQSAYVLVKMCESYLNRTYSLLPMLEDHVMGSQPIEYSTHEVLGDTSLSVEALVRSETPSGGDNILTNLHVNSPSSISHCLSPIYKKIQTSLAKLYQTEGGAVDTRPLHKLLEVVQWSLQEKRPLVVNSQWLSSDILCLEGFHSSAIGEWLQQCAITQHKGRASRGLHSVLYNKLYHGRLSEALEFVEKLILNDLSRQSHNFEKEYLDVKSLQPGSPVKKIVQSLARFMARYFANRELYVFPSHNPHPLPALYSLQSDYVSMLSVDRKCISEAARKLPTDLLWSAEATVRYLLISGLLAELVWFCRGIGDLKACLSVSLLTSDHLTALKHLKRQEVNSLLPDELSPQSVHMHMFEQLHPGEEDTTADVRSSLHQLLLPPALFGLHSLSTQLSRIWQRIKTSASHLSAFVPNELYLPSPALYCPQIATEVKDLPEELAEELETRRLLSADIKLVVDLLVATHTDLACCGWLVRGLMEAWKLKNKKKKLSVHRGLEVYISYHVSEKDKTNKLIFAIFRNVCCILWMLHVRDELSLKLRRSTQLLHGHVAVVSQAEERDDAGNRYKHLEDTLSWCLRYLPFSQYLQSTNSICEVIISICEDLPATAKLARKLSQGITDIDSLAPEVKDKMDHLLQTWQTVDLDPHKSRSLSMYYFECCNKYEDESAKDQTERHIFSSVHGHKTIGSRAHEFDSMFVSFMELYFQVCFHCSVPGSGTTRPPALVPSNKKTLEQACFDNKSLTFTDRTRKLGDMIAKHGGTDLVVNEEAEKPLSDSLSKSGLFRSKRWSANEEQTIKQMRKMGVSEKFSQATLDASTSNTLPDSSLLGTPPSHLLLTQKVKLSERYQKLGIKFQWLLSWSERQLGTRATQQAGTKVNIDLQWMTLALIMVEKCRQPPSRGSEANVLPPKVQVPVPSVSPPAARIEANVSLAASAPSEDITSSALANAISLHAYTDVDLGVSDEEEIMEEVLEEMRKHSRLTTATQPINAPLPKSPATGDVSKDDMTPEKSHSPENRQEREDQGSADSYILNDSATTVWSSATLPNMSGSSLVTAAMQAETLDTEPQSTAKTQQSVSTIGSRRSRSRGKTPDKYMVPVAESTHHDLDTEDMSGQSSPTTRFCSQIPLLRITKESKNQVYYSSPKKEQSLASRRRPQLLKVDDVRNAVMESQTHPQPESVKLPLLSLKAAALESSPTHISNTDQQRLAEIRQTDSRWNQPVPLLQFHQPQSNKFSENLQPPTHNPPPSLNKPSRSIALAHGPSLLQQYDEANRQKDELITRMIRIMRSKARPGVAEGKPIHPKYELLKLDPAVVASDGAVRSQQTVCEPQAKGRDRRIRKKKSRRVKVKADLAEKEAELATVSEKTEDSPKRVDVGTEPDETETLHVDKGVQHNIAVIEGHLTDYSYLFSLATSAHGEEREVDVGELDEAADQNTFAAVQYQAIKLQKEAERKPEMVDASVMAVEPIKAKTVIVRSEKDTDVPVVAPNILHQLQFQSARSALHADKENIPEKRRDYLGVADITPSDVPRVGRPIAPADVAAPQPRSQQVLAEMAANIADKTEDADLPDATEISSAREKPTIVPYQEYKELSPPKIIAPRRRFVSADSKDEGKLTIARNLSNMEDRLEYIEELKDDMMRQIEDTQLVAPRYHLTYQQRQTQTRLSIPMADEYITVLQPAGTEDSQPEETGRTSKSSPGEESSRPGATHRSVSARVDNSKSKPTRQMSHGSRREEISMPDLEVETHRTTGSSLAVPAVERAGWSEPTSARRSPSESQLRYDPISSQRSPAMPASPRSDVDISLLNDSNDLVRLAEQIVGDDKSLTGDINSTMLADLLGSDASLLSPTRADVGKKPSSSLQRKEELKKWRKEHQAKVREKYRQEVETTRRPEAHPFNTDKNVTAKQIKRVKKEREEKREQMIARNQSKRIENAEHLLEDLMVDGAELLAMEKMMDLTTPIASKRSAKPNKGQTTSVQKKPLAFQRGKSTIRAPASQQVGTTPARPSNAYTPSGFRTVAHPSSSALQLPTHADASSYDVDELPLYDESELLVPIFSGQMAERERIHQLLYPDRPFSRLDSETLSNISDFAPMSEVSGESYLDWDVVDEMVAMLSNKGSSTPSTPAGLI